MNQKKVRGVYQVFARWYDSTKGFWNARFAASAEVKFEQLFAKYVKGDVKILDVGCGTGVNIERLLRRKIHFCSYEGIDLSPEMLAVAQRKFPKAGNVTFQTGDIARMDIAQKYDVVVSTLVFSHLERQDEVVQKLLVALKPNGVMLLMFFAERSVKTWRDKLALRAYRSLFRFDHVPTEMTQKFPPSREEHHFPCLGGQISIYVFSKN